MSRTGNWLEPDRAGMVDGPNLFAYVKNAPTLLIDPTGEGGVLIEGISPFFEFNVRQMLRNTSIGYDLWEEIQFSDVYVTIQESLAPSAPSPGPVVTSLLAHYVATTGSVAGSGCIHGGPATFKYVNIVISTPALAFWNGGGSAMGGAWSAKHDVGEIAAHELGHVVGFIELGGNLANTSFDPTGTEPAACKAGRQYRSEHS